MNETTIIKALLRNRSIFKALLTDIPKEEYLWKSSPKKWCILEIVCHLYDEEMEDFRARTQHVLDTPQKELPAIDPSAWVQERKYIQKDYAYMLHKFLEERKQSVAWLQSLVAPQWDNATEHHKFGAMTAKMFLANWLAHDYLHIRQILKVKFDYTQQLNDEHLTYAGTWND